MIDITLDEFVYQLSTWVLPVLFAIGCHEAAHGWAASKFGDDTARRLGRVTLNPVAHIDPFGTLLLPGILIATGSPFLIGYAKPVPVDFDRLRPGRLPMVLVAAAGPAANLALCVVSLVILQVAGWAPGLPGADWLAETARKSVVLNAVLAVFNMLPLLPLDGGRIVAALVSPRFARHLDFLERTGLTIIILSLFVIAALSSIADLDFDPLDWLVWQPVRWILEGLNTPVWTTAP